LHFTTLTKLWASVVALNPDGASFVTSLEILGSMQIPHADFVSLVEELISCKPSKDLVRQALQWLGQFCPDEAVRQWPALFEESVEGVDVEALLTLCEMEGLQPPEIGKLVACGLSDEVLETLAASSIPEARLLVVQALGEKHCKLEDIPKIFGKLRDDPCKVVTVAARNLWVGLEEGDKSAAFAESAQQDGDEDEEASYASESQEDESGMEGDENFATAGWRQLVAAGSDEDED